MRAGLLMQLVALKKLGQHLGMYPPLRSESPRVPFKIIGLIFYRMSLPGILPEQRYACALLLDYYAPGWRKAVPRETLGYCVKRDSTEVWHWKKEVLKRDGYRCRKCGSKYKLNVHHVVPWSESFELRIVVANGLTLCEGCHIKEHHGKLREVR